MSLNVSNHLWVQPDPCLPREIEALSGRRPIRAFVVTFPIQSLTDCISWARTVGESRPVNQKGLRYRKCEYSKRRDCTGAPGTELIWKEIWFRYASP